MAINKTRAGSAAALAGLAYMLNEKRKDKLAKLAGSTDTVGDRDDAYMGEMMRANAGATKSVDTPTPTEVPFKGMPVKESDELPEYLSKQSNNKIAKAAITDVYGYTDKSPAYKKNEHGEVYQAIPEDMLEEYHDRRKKINANVDNPGYSKGMKRGGAVKKFASGGSVSSASKRADGIATKGKTRGRIC
jgi:hypothetical protein